MLVATSHTVTGLRLLKQYHKGILGNKYQWKIASLNPSRNPLGVISKNQFSVRSYTALIHKTNDDTALQTSIRTYIKPLLQATIQTNIQNAASNAYKFNFRFTINNKIKKGLQIFGVKADKTFSEGNLGNKFLFVQANISDYLQKLMIKDMPNVLTSKDTVCAWHSSIFRFSGHASLWQRPRQKMAPKYSEIRGPKREVAFSQVMPEILGIAATVMRHSFHYNNQKCAPKIRIKQSLTSGNIYKAVSKNYNTVFNANWSVLTLKIASRRFFRGYHKRLENKALMFGDALFQKFSYTVLSLRSGNFISPRLISSVISTMVKNYRHDVAGMQVDKEGRTYLYPNLVIKKIEGGENKTTREIPNIPSSVNEIEMHKSFQTEIVRASSQENNTFYNNIQMVDVVKQIYKSFEEKLRFEQLKKGY